MAVQRKRSTTKRRLPRYLESLEDRNMFSGAPPTLFAPTSVTVTEDTLSEVNLSLVQVADSESDLLTLTLSASAGTFAPPYVNPFLALTTTLVNSTTITIQGFAGDINFYLADSPSGIRYTGPSNVHGLNAAQIDLIVNDGLQDSPVSTVHVDITNVNDFPMLTNAPTSFTLLEDTASEIDLSGMTVSDVDNDQLTLTLLLGVGNEANGTFSPPADGSGVGAGVVTSHSASMVTVQGATADLNSYLQNPSNLKFTPASNVHGDGLFTIGIMVDDNFFAEQRSASVSVTPMNDPPTLVATGQNPTFTEGGAPVDLFSNATANTVEAGQVLTGFSVTTNIFDLTETLTIDGSPIAISESNVGTTAENNLIYSVSTSGGSATVSFSNGNLTAAAFQTIVDAMTYSNSSNNPTTGDRVVTITSLLDDGGFENGGSGSASLSVSSTVSLTTDVNAPVSDSDIMFIVDMSSSLNEQDVQSQKDFITNMIDYGISASSRVGVIAFDTSARIVANMSSDHEAVKQALQGASRFGALSYVDDALNLAISAFNETTGPFTNRLLLLFADNASTLHSPCGPENAELPADLNNANIERLFFPVGSNPTVASFSCLLNDPASQIVSMGSFNSATLDAINVPKIQGSITDLNFVEDTIGNVDLSGYDLAGIVADTITVTLTSSDGTFATPAEGAGIGLSVTETLINSNTITLVGDPFSVTEYLTTASNIQYTGPLNANGNNAATLTIAITAGADTLMLEPVNLDIAGVNDQPTISGVPTDVTVTEDVVSSFDLSNVTISDVDGDQLFVQLYFGPGWIVTAADGSGVGAGVVELPPVPGSVILQGTGEDITSYLDTAANIRFQPLPDLYGDDVGTFQITVSDSVATPVAATGNIDITPVNDRPTSADNTLVAVEDTPIEILTADFSYADVEGDPLYSVFFQAAPLAGMLFVDANSNDRYDAGERLTDGTEVMLVDIEAGNLQYVSGANENGVGYASFDFYVGDGIDFSHTLYTMTIDVTSVNDAPTGTGLPSDVAVTDGITTPFDISTVTVVDFEDDSLRILLAASQGTFTSADASGVTVIGSGTGALELSGTPADLNTFFDDPNNIHYTNAEALSGDNTALYLMHAYDGSLGKIIGHGNIDVVAASTIDLEVNAVADTRLVLDGQPFAWSVVVTNRSSETVNASATGIEIANVYPPELQLITATTTNGTAVGPTWTLTEPLLPGATASLTLLARLSADAETGDRLPVYAYAQTANELDVDSTPGTRDTAEDDADVFVVTVGPRLDARPSLHEAASPETPTVETSGNRVVAVATAGDDVVEFRAGTSIHTLNISGHTFEFDASTITEVFIGGASGQNSVILVGTEADESGQINGPNGSLTDGTYTVNTFSFDRTVIDTAGGADVVQLFGSNSVDALEVISAQATMRTPTHTHHVENAERVDAFGRGGADTATFFGTAGTETFVALNDQDQFRSVGKLFTAKGFATVNVHSGGGQDRAQVHDTAADDTYIGAADTSTMSAPGRVRHVHDFVSVIASSLNGGTDQATLSGVSGVRDVYVSGAGFSEMIGARNRNRAVGFAIEAGTSNDNLDEANFVGLTGTETFLGDGSVARVEGARNSRAEGFRLVSAENSLGEAPVGDLRAIDFVLRIVGDWA